MQIGWPHSPFQPNVVRLWLAGLLNAILLNVLWSAGAYFIRLKTRSVFLVHNLKCLVSVCGRRQNTENECSICNKAKIILQLSNDDLKCDWQSKELTLCNVHHQPHPLSAVRSALSHGVRHFNVYSGISDLQRNLQPIFMTSFHINIFSVLTAVRCSCGSGCRYRTVLMHNVI